MADQERPSFVDSHRCFESVVIQMYCAPHMDISGEEEVNDSRSVRDASTHVRPPLFVFNIAIAIISR